MVTSPTQKRGFRSPNDLVTGPADWPGQPPRSKDWLRHNPNSRRTVPLRWTMRFTWKSLRSKGAPADLAKPVSRVPHSPPTTLLRTTPCSSCIRPKSEKTSSSGRNMPNRAWRPPATCPPGEHPHGAPAQILPEPASLETDKTASTAPWPGCPAGASPPYPPAPWLAQCPGPGPSPASDHGPYPRWA